MFSFAEYNVVQWRTGHRAAASCVVRTCLQQYGLEFEPEGEDRDAVEVEECYQRENRGEFWVVLDQESGALVGTGGFHELPHEPNTVEIRKMYLLRQARGKGLGRMLLQAAGECSHNSLICIW